MYKDDTGEVGEFFLIYVELLSGEIFHFKLPPMYFMLYL